MTSDDRSAWLDALVLAGERRVPTTIGDEPFARCTPDEAYALQDAHLARTLQRLGGGVLGMKLGATTEAGLAKLGLAGPFAGPILSARTQASPARWPRGDFIVCLVEAEVGVRLRVDLEPEAAPRSRETLIDAIEAVFPAIELADSRLAHWDRAGANAIVADLGYAGAWVHGADVADWRAIDLARLEVTLTLDGTEVRRGTGDVVLGDPLRALALGLVELGRRGRRLSAGDVVSTGTCTVPLPSPSGGRFVADFGPLGSVVVDLLDRP